MGMAWVIPVGGNMQKRILVFGGSFDPIHVGHLYVADQVQKILDYDEVWFVPCQSSRYNKNLSHWMNRCDMVAVAINEHDNPTFRLSESEFECNAQGKMYVLADHLRCEYPECEFDFLIGSDSLKYINSWYRAKDLTSEFNFVIVSRNGYEMDLDGISNGIALDMKIPNISSTVVRKSIKEYGMSVLVPMSVSKFIKGRKLYA